MKTKMIVTAAAVVSLALLVSALWAWREAVRLADGFRRPEVEAWAVRSAAVAAAAAAQALLLVVVLKRRERADDLSLFEPIQRPDPLGKLLSCAAGIVSGVALVSAVALGLAGR